MSMHRAHRMKSNPSSWIAWTLLPALLIGASSCGKKDEGTTCTVALTGSPWVPNVPNASNANHDVGGTVTTTVSQVTGVLTGLQQPVTVGQLITVPIDMSQDLGADGSLTIQGRGTTMPSGLVGTATPSLI